MNTAIFRHFSPAEAAIIPLMEGAKVCRKCGEIKVFSLFRYGATGSRICKTCHRKRQRAWYAATLEQRRKYAREYVTAGATNAFEVRRCGGCDREFNFYKAHANSKASAGKYCSVECRRKRVDKPCARCRKSFSVWPCMENKRKYCSQHCAGTAISPEERAKREALLDLKLHHNSSEWRRASEAAMARDVRCVDCGSDYLLVVHHIVSWRLTQDDSLSNLVTLCRSCHSARHRNVRDGRIAFNTVTP